jgi:transposase-like protein
MDCLALVRKQVEQADTDLLREMVKLFCERVMSDEADAICGAPYGERSDERTNRRNGYRSRPWDTRTGTIDLTVPKLREGSYFPTGCSSLASASSGRSSRWSASPT